MQLDPCVVVFGHALPSRSVPKAASLGEHFVETEKLPAYRRQVGYGYPTFQLRLAAPKDRERSIPR